MADALKMVYEQDAPIAPLKGKTVAVIGFGSQGHAHSLNLRDSGVKVVVANRKDSANGRLAHRARVRPRRASRTPSRQGDLVIITLPDEVQPEVYNKSIKPHLKAGKSVGVTHGFNFHFKTIEAPKDVDVLLVAPKGPGHLVRSEYEKGGGVPCLLAIHQNPTGNARDIGLAWANGVGGARSRHHRDHLQGRVRDRPVRRTGRPLRRARRAHQGRVRDAHRGRLPAGDGVLRVRPRGEAHRRPDLPGRPGLHAVTRSATPPSTATSPAARAWSTRRRRRR